MQNPFPVSFGQAILDSIVNATATIFSPAVLAVVIPFILKIGIVGAVAFALFSFGFKGFSMLSSGGLVDGDFVDKYVPKKEKEEKGLRGKPLTAD